MNLQHTINFVNRFWPIQSISFAEFLSKKYSRKITNPSIINASAWISLWICKQVMSVAVAYVNAIKYILISASNANLREIHLLSSSSSTNISVILNSEKLIKVVNFVWLSWGQNSLNVCCVYHLRVQPEVYRDASTTFTFTSRSRSWSQSGGIVIRVAVLESHYHSRLMLRPPVSVSVAIKLDPGYASRYWNTHHGIKTVLITQVTVSTWKLTL